MRKKIFLPHYYFKLSKDELYSFVQKKLFSILSIGIKSHTRCSQTKKFYASMCAILKLNLCGSTNAQTLTLYSTGKNTINRTLFKTESFSYISRSNVLTIYTLEIIEDLAAIFFHCHNN